MPQLTPTAPTGVVASAGNGQADVSWHFSTPNGTPIISYTAISTPTGKTCTAGPKTTHCTVSNLRNGTAYVFRVRATNGQGNGPLSTASKAVTPVGSPVAAPVITGASSGDKQVSLSWDAVPVLTDGGYVISGYVLRAKAGTDVVRTELLPATARSYTFTTLTNGTSYLVSVAAQNAKGTGPFAVASAQVPSTVPAPPTGVTVTAENGQAVVHWLAAPDRGTPVTGYTATSTPTGKFCTTTTALTCTVKTLVNGRAYTFRVHARNGRGTGPTSTKTNTVVPNPLPSAPTTWSPRPTPSRPR